MRMARCVMTIQESKNSVRSRLHTSPSTQPVGLPFNLCLQTFRPQPIRGPDRITNGSSSHPECGFILLPLWQITRSDLRILCLQIPGQ